MADHPLHSLLQQRHSNRHFLETPVEPEKLKSLLEAARWAPSSRNSQPWRFIFAARGDENFEAFFQMLKPVNQKWARPVPLFILSAAKMSAGEPPRENRYAIHDTGMATAQLIIQAVALGLQVHPMGGYDREKARELCALPDDIVPVAMLAVGYEDPDKPREHASTERQPQAEFVFHQSMT